MFVYLAVYVFASPSSVVLIDSAAPDASAGAPEAQGIQAERAEHSPPLSRYFVLANLWFLFTFTGEYINYHGSLAVGRIPAPLDVYLDISTVNEMLVIDDHTVFHLFPGTRSCFFAWFSLDYQNV